MFSRQFFYIGFSLIVFGVACGDTKQQAGPPAQPPVPVLLEEVKSGDAVYYDEYPATITALNEIDLRPQVSGYINGIHFRDGDRVKKGQLLYSVDAQLYSANYDQAVAGLRAQEASLLKAQKDANRFHELDKQDAVAKQLVDNADAALEVAKKQVDAAQANIAAVQTNVRYTKVYAPFDGVIGISQVKPGTAVSAGQTILNTISSSGDLAVDFNVDQKEILRFDQLLKEKKSDSTFSLAFGKEVYPHPGKIAFLDRAVNAQTGTIKARLIFPNKDQSLRTGMNGTVRVKNNSDEKSLVIPHKAVTEQLGEYFVYVKGDSNKVSQQKVVLGKPVGSNIIVKDGLKEGDSIAVQGVQNLKEGSVIRSVPAAPAQAKNK